VASELWNSPAFSPSILRFPQVMHRLSTGRLRLKSSKNSPIFPLFARSFPSTPPRRNDFSIREVSLSHLKSALFVAIGSPEAVFSPLSLPFFFLRTSRSLFCSQPYSQIFSSFSQTYAQPYAQDLAQALPLGRYASPPPVFSGADRLCVSYDYLAKSTQVAM